MESVSLTLLIHRPRIAIVAYLLLLQFFYSWAWSSSDVLRPLFRTELGLSLAAAGSAYSAQVVGALLGALSFGVVQHQLGRRATLALVSCGCGLTFAAGAIVDGLATLVAQRLMLGLFMGAVFPVTIGLIADLFPPGQRGRLASLIDSTYFAAVVLLGWAAAATITSDWQLMFWPIGLLLVVLGLFAYALPLPIDLHRANGRAPRVRDLFSQEWRRLTASLILMIAANACGHQAFVGWLTVYLVEEARLTLAATATILSVQYAGSITGCFAWGFLADRFGRRVGAFGLLAAGAATTLFLAAGEALWLRQLAVFAFGFAFAAVVNIGPILAELYPASLRGPATSLFQWGRFFSLFAPPLTGVLAAATGLSSVMGLAAVAFFLSGLIWRSLPGIHQSDWRTTVAQPNRSTR